MLCLVVSLMRRSCQVVFFFCSVRSVNGWFVQCIWWGALVDVTLFSHFTPSSQVSLGNTYQTCVFLFLFFPSFLLSFCWVCLFVCLFVRLLACLFVCFLSCNQTGPRFYVWIARGSILPFLCPSLHSQPNVVHAFLYFVYFCSRLLKPFYLFLCAFFHIRFIFVAHVLIHLHPCYTSCLREPCSFPYIGLDIQSC